MNVHDSTNITGISTLVQYDGAEDISQIEKSLIENTTSEKTDPSDVETYKKQLEELGSALGISLDDSEKGIDSNESDSDEDDNRDDGDVSDDSSSSDKKSMSGGYGYTPGGESGVYDNVPRYTPSSRNYVNHMTEEQKKQRILKHALSGIEDNKFSVEKEKEEDDKAILLEQIDMLITNLKDEGIDVSRVPFVDNNSPIEDIENVHKILRLKNDRNRYCSFAEECILAGSHTLEWLFDGEKSYMGRKPDLRGWSATVNIKLRRMRYDTSTFVSGVMQDYNLGHGTRILFELLPSLFLYSKMKKAQYSDNLITSDEMNSAIDKIRDIEEGS